MSADRKEGPAKTESTELARRIAAIVDEKQAEDVVALDMRGVVGYTDFLIICTARNERHARAIHEEVHLLMKRDHGLLPANTEGQGEGGWILADYLDCVLHVFVPDFRERYRMEVLWSEAPRLELDAQELRSSA
ncbi:MAG: ribosome silencing factor [Solirubrobacterales bacterium]